jgi:hypothetical protein
MSKERRKERSIIKEYLKYLICWKPNKCWSWKELITETEKYVEVEQVDSHL